MKWISNVNKRSILPILLGISLTTFGLSVAILLYSMFEKDDNNDRKKYSQTATSKRKEICVQFGIPEKYVSAVIGKGGTVIKNIEELTNTHIKMEKANISSERVCYLWSDNKDNICSAQNMIQSIINNVPDSVTYELFVPFDVSRKVLKKRYDGREFAHLIQKTHGTKIIIENDAHKTETGVKRRIILKGTSDQIAAAIIEIEDKIQNEVEAETQLKLQVARMKSTSSDNNDVINTNDHPDVETFELLVPRDTCGRIIGKNGWIIQEMEKSSGAKITIENNRREDNKSKVTILGTAKQIELAVMQIENKVKEAGELNYESTMNIKRISDSLCNNNSSTSNNVSKLSKIAFKEADLMEVYVSAMKTPSRFWIQVVGPANIDLQNLIHDMTEYYDEEENRKLHTLKKVTVGQMVAAKFKYDNKWYRAEVIFVHSDAEFSGCEVFFVDYGDIEIVPIEDVLELRTDMLSLRLQAVECSLANVKPRESEWSSEANDHFAELVHLAKWKPLAAKIRGYKERPVGYGGFRRQNSLLPCIELYDKDNDEYINIGDSLIQLRMAEIENEVSSTVNSTLPYDKCDSSFVPFLSDSRLNAFQL